MSGPRRRKTPARPARRRRPVPTRDFWGREPAADDQPVTIRPSEDPTAMIRSLGPPPFPGGETLAEHYFAATYEKAAAVAIALAAASDLLDTDEPDD
jgi:hypothetical protein